MSNAAITVINQTAVHAQLGIVAGLPLLGSALAYVVGRKNRDAAGWIATAAAALSFLWVLKLFAALSPEHYFEQRLAPWFSAPGLSVDFLLRFDQLTAVMCLIITGIGSLIHLYSIGYMAEDESRHRFFSYMNLFLFSMLTLVLGGNLLVLFIGWEGVGLCSYLLIGFWFKNLDYAGAGRKAFVVNRISDAGMLLAMFLLIQQFGTLDFVQLRALIGDPSTIVTVGGVGLLSIVAACLFIGATGKSAQIPLFVWLPDAMAGPTPVSALIHAATMVTAGLYLMARTNFIFDMAPSVMGVIIIIAVLTAFIAATIALAQNDIKKVLAYSTVSQLGFMFMAAGMGAYWIAIFHVITHALFKGCLFLCAGSVIMGCHHEQDMRKLGGLAKLMPITFATYLVSTLAIAGIYPFSGYQSKHAIVEALIGPDNPLHVVVASWVPILVSITAFLTAFYMTRSVALTFFGSYRGANGHDHHDANHDTKAKHDSHADKASSHTSHDSHQPHESPWVMTLPLILLGTGATVAGLLLQSALPEFLSPVLPRAHAHVPATVVEGIKGSWLGIVGVFLGLILYTKLQIVPRVIGSAFMPITKLFAGKWYFDELYAALIVRPLEGASQALWRIVDSAIIDGTVNGTGKIVDINGEWLRGTQTGQIRHYLLLMFFAAVVMLVFCFVL